MQFVTKEDITLLESNISEGYYQGSPVTDGLWAAGSYSTGAQVYYDGAFPYMVYESLVDSNTATPGTDPTKWKSKGATDRDLMFDPFMETQSEYLEEIEIDIDSSGCNYVGFFNVQATDLELSQIINTELMTSPDCTSDECSKGTGWAYDAGNDQYDCDGSQVADTLLTEEAASLAQGDIRQVQFKVENYAAGNLAGYAGGEQGSNVAANGTYTQIITAGSTDSKTGVVGDADFIGSVSILSVKEVVKHEILDLDASLVIDWPSYFMAAQEYKEKVTWLFPQYSDSTLRAKLTWKTGEMAQAGILRIGKAVEIGGTLLSPDIGINDYSSIDEDPDFGLTYLNPGSFSDDGDFKVWFWNTRLDSVKRLFRNNRGKEVILDFNHTGATYYEALVYFCFIKKWRISIHGAIRSRITIKAKGLI